jgi:hypothetical protein
MLVVGSAIIMYGVTIFLVGSATIMYGVTIFS